jgi:hypothetical protein
MANAKGVKLSVNDKDRPEGALGEMFKVVNPKVFVSERELPFPDNELWKVQVISAIIFKCLRR